MRRADGLGSCTALVTGASSGIGEAIARALAARGVGRLVLVARRRARLDALAADLGDRAVPIATDLTRPAEVEALVARERSVDLLVNNAGFGWTAPLVEQDAARLAEMIDLNCGAVVRLTSAWTPGMVARGRGWVLNVGSIAGMVPVPQMAVYGATKAFVHSFTEALRVELRGTGVRVHLLAPGPVMSEFFTVAHPGAERPARALFLGADRVAGEAIDALLADRARLIPGLPYRLGAEVAAALPAAAFRPLARLARGTLGSLGRRKVGNRRSGG